MATKKQATKKQSFSDLLTSLNLTTAELAARTGYTHFAISYWRRGSANSLSGSAVVNLATALPLKGSLDQKKSIILEAYAETRRRRLEREAAGLDARTVDMKGAT